MGWTNRISISGRGKRVFFFFRTGISSGTHILLLKGYYRACSPAVNFLRYEADNLLPPSAKGKNECSSTSAATNFNGMHTHNSTFTSYTYVLH